MASDTLFDAGTTYCRGCGLIVSWGASYCAMPDDPPLPTSWPFTEDNCPVCAIRAEYLELYEATKPWPKGKRRPLPG